MPRRPYKCNSKIGYCRAPNKCTVLMCIAFGVRQIGTISGYIRWRVMARWWCWYNLRRVTAMYVRHAATATHRYVCRDVTVCLIVRIELILNVVTSDFYHSIASAYAKPAATPLEPLTIQLVPSLTNDTQSPTTA